LLSATASACGASTPLPDVAELTAQLDRAHADSQLATDAAGQARGAIAMALTALAAERLAHAKALSDELVRIVGNDAPTTSPSGPTSTTAEAATAPTVKDVIGALRQSGETAAELAAKLSGYRAGLLGSIAAACTAAFTVALVPPEAAR
jgi:hypothetical protein